MSLKRKKGHSIIAYMFFLILIGVSAMGTLQVSTTTIANDITGTMTIYGDDTNGNMRELLSEGDRANLVVKVIVVLSGSEGIDRIDASLHTIASDGGLGERQAILTMSSDTDLRRSAEFDVAGFGTGYYFIHLNGYATTHPVTTTIQVKNPDYRTWESWAIEQDSADVYLILDGIEYNYLSGPPATIDGTLTEVKDDVDMFLPADVKVYVENPWENVEFTFTKTQTTLDSEVGFDFQVQTGSVSGYELVIHDSDWGRVISTTAVNDFIFNTNKGQADGLYHAVLYVTGNPGWVGGSKQIDFTIDNPDSISGVVNIYILDEGAWVLAEDVLKGDIKIVVTDLTGNPSRVYVDFIEALTMTYDLEYDSVLDEYSVVIDTTLLNNGNYEVQVIAVRSEDNALSYLSAWDMGMTGGTDSFAIVFFLIGLTGLMFLIMTDEQFGIMKKFKK